jgi:hypothetical protein
LKKEGQRAGAERGWQARKRMVTRGPTDPVGVLAEKAVALRTSKKIRPRNLAVPGPNLGVGVRHALFPGGTLLGALAFAGRVLPDATLRGMRMSRSHGGTVPALAGWNLSSEASSPSSATSCRRELAGRGADTPAIRTFRVGTVATGTAPAFGRTLALRYGSDLLTLRLRSLLQRGDAVFRAAPSRRLTGFARPAHSPPSRLLCAPGLSGLGLLAGVDPTGKRDCVLVVHSSNLNPLGNCVGLRFETDRGPDSAWTRFLIAPRRSAPDSCETDRARPRPEELVISACRQPLARVRRGGWHQLPPTFPRSPGIIPALLSAKPFQAAAHRLFYQGTGMRVRRPAEMGRFCTAQLFHRGRGA